MTALAFADRKNQTSDRYEIDGFPIRWNADTHALVISSRFPTVLSQVYDYLRSVSGDSLVQCQSLYSRDGRHGLFFQFCRAIDGAVLNELDRVQASWQLLRPAQVSSFDAHAF